MIKKVALTLISTEPHTSMIITGFLMLAEQGKIKLDVSVDFGRTQPIGAVIEADIDGVKVLFDMQDGYNFREPLPNVERYMDQFDYCFKRSFNTEMNKRFSPQIQDKLYMLGLNYHVTYKGNPLDRKWSAKQLVKMILGYKNERFFIPEVFENTPIYNKNPKVLFCCRLWDSLTCGEAEKKQNEKVNEMRISIINTMKALYPNNFIGGVSANETARKYCPELIIPYKITNRRSYIELMKQSDVCIGTIGLHRSTGWKTAEYVAASKAIVNEKLFYEVDGVFSEGVNYLSFTDADDCCSKVDMLLHNPDAIFEMKKANEKYYNTYLRPDMLILRALDILDKKSTSMS